MRALISVLALFIIFSCSRESSNEASVSTGDLKGKKNSQEFVQTMKQDLSPELVITEDDLSTWVQEGLITQEEASVLKMN